MSLATRCPACGTTFKVVPDQLRISEGWVRCGRCSHVFDGNEHLNGSDANGPQPSATADKATPGPSTPAQAPAPAPPEAAPLSPASVASPASPASFVASPGSAAVPLADIDFFSDTLLRLKADAPDSPAVPTDPGAPLALVTDHVPQPPRTQPVTLEAPTLGWPAFSGYASASSPVPVIEFPVDQAAAPAAFGVQAVDAWSRLPSLHLGNVPPLARTSRVEGDRFDSHVVGPPDDAQFQKALRRARVKSAKIAKARAKAKDGEAAAIVRTASEAVEPQSAASEAIAVPAPLGRHARPEPDASRRRAWGAAQVWSALSTVALLLLVAQVTYQERSAIIARQPALRPAFASACEVLGCQLSPLQHIADIVIDGASFAREKGGEGYQLSFTLRNRAELPLAMPALELSLIDLQERTVVRRVLRPEDFGAPAVLAGHAERTALLPISLAGGDASALPRVAGFHLDAFYP